MVASELVSSPSVVTRRAVVAGAATATDAVGLA